MGLRRTALGVAAALPPLVATGPAVLGVLAFTAIAAGWQLTGRWWIAVGGVVGVLLPGIAGVTVPALAGAALLAAAPWPWAVAGLPVAVAPLLLQPSVAPFTAVAGLAVAAVMRWVAHHPANLSMARTMAALGLVSAAAPAGAALVLAALGIAPDTTWAVFVSAVMLGVLGVLVLMGHLGLVGFLRSNDPLSALWLAAVICVPAVALAFALAFGLRSGLAEAPPLAGLLGVPVGVGVALSWRAWGKRGPS